ncbi:hypothetical protein ACJMK2_024214 [Sinanodonta woodiana]|uniref:Mediator of RNA polymerase II transcription subunit 24 n=1 Tax=Sinanodonta woodiana TaxID=1069815 RepID=A0ABD3T6Q0_SINWO
MDDTSSRQQSPLITKVKALLMRAWRERWSDIQWGIQLKRILSSFSQSVDTKELADILLQQALVGTHPNQLILSYVKQAVFSQVIPPSAAFRFFINFDDYSRPYCLLGLLDLAQDFASNLSFTSGLDNGITLSRNLQSLIHWLLLCMLKSLQKIHEHLQQEYVSVLDAAGNAVQKTLESATVRGLLYIARSEDIDTYRDLEQTEVNVRGTASQIPNDALPKMTRLNVGNTLKALSRIQELTIPSEPVFELPHLPLCPTVNTMAVMEAVLNPTNDVQPFVDQLFVIERLLKLSRSYIYCELFRACYMGLVDGKDYSGGQEELKWAAFTFLKLPQILHKISQQSPGQDFFAELEQGFDMLLNYVPMLDLTDVKLNCDCLMFLLTECKKLNLLSEVQQNRLLQRRSNESLKQRACESSTTQPSASLILRAEPTVTSILKTLDADYSKNQEALLGVLCHMLSGKSFELILAAAAATGKLQSFAFKLIKFNEFAKRSALESNKGANTRALLFDISFLMLCHITQLYGTEIITNSPECMDSFFVQWALKCLPEDGKYKSTDSGLLSDPNEVDALLTQFTTGKDLRQGFVDWHEICINSPLAIQEVLFAWEHGAINVDKVKSILNYVKTKMCFLPVVICAWLCSYMNTLSEDARTKPLAMLQLLSQIGNPIDPESSRYYNERSHLMVTILNRMNNDILPSSKRSMGHQFILSSALPSDVMGETLRSVFNAGWLDLRSLHTLEQLLNLCGSDWFCDRLVYHMLQSNRCEDLTQALSLVYAITHIDPEHMTLSLLIHTVPLLLQSAEKQHLLTDPRGYTLAKLCVLCITSAQTAKVTQKDSSSYRRGRKRYRKEDLDLDDIEETETRPVKKNKSMEPQITLDSEEFIFDIYTTKDEGESSPTIDTKDSLSKAIVSLFRLMMAIVKDGKTSPKNNFIISVVKESIKCGPKHSRFILQFMPPTMLSHLMKCVPGEFKNDHILHISDLSTKNGRKMAAKDICQNARYMQQE